MARRKLNQKEVREAAQAGIPVLRGRKDGVHLIVWCPYCCREHLHGHGGDGPFEMSHRSAHCTTALYGEEQEGSFRETGYYIFYADKPDRRMRRP